MKSSRIPIFAFFFSLFLTSGVSATAEDHDSWRAISLNDSKMALTHIRTSDMITNLAKEASLQAVEEEGKGFVAEDEVWTTVIDMRDSHDHRIGSYQGDIMVYPASVIKLCYMLAAYDQVPTGKIEMDEKLQSDIAQMITVSNNKATNRVLDRVTNTYFGPDLSGEALESFEYKRQAVNRYLTDIGLEDLWATNKTYDSGIPLYGRDIQWLGGRAGDNFEKSNMMTTDDTAKLLYLIWNKAVVSPEACDKMLKHMDRNGENKAIFSKMVPEGVKLYSKDGYTGLCKHDAGIFELPGEKGSVIIVSFSKIRNASGDRPQVIERTAEIILEKLMNEEGELDLATADEQPEQE